ncbi:MAG: hypothetical protein ACYTFQ_18590, partial [Planctomycetota bacterium]
QTAWLTVNILALNVKGINGVGPGNSIWRLTAGWCTDVFLSVARPLRIEYEGAVYHVTLRGESSVSGRRSIVVSSNPGFGILMPRLSKVVSQAQ